MAPPTFTLEQMIGVNSISYQSLLANRLRESTLERSVATVDQEEANNGAAQSDMFRQSVRDEKVPFSVYLQRAAQFRGQLKKTNKTEEDSKPEVDCPIAKARAASQTGENAPVNWLIADHFGGDAEPELAGGEFVSSAPKAPSQETFSLNTQPVIGGESSSLMENEWLIAPGAL